MSTATDIHQRLRRVALAAFLAAIIAAPASAQFVALTDSSYGSGDTYDLTSLVPTTVPLDSYLPVDTSSGWTETTLSGCTEGDLDSAISAAPDFRVIHFPTNCQMQVTRTDNTGSPVFSIPSDTRGLVIRANADGLSEINFVVTGTPPASGWSHKLFAPGTGSAITSWTWDSGYARGTNLIGSSQTIADVYAGDEIELTVDSFTDHAQDYRRSVSVVCAHWTNGTVQPPATEPCASDPTGTIRIDMPHELDYTGATYTTGGGSWTGQTIHHLSRLGGGTIDVNEPTLFGVEGIKITHSNPYMNERHNSFAFQFNGCFECWTHDVHFATPWANAVLQHQTGASRVLHLGDRFDGQEWAVRCVESVTALTTGTPAKATVSLTAGCSGSDDQPWCTSFEPAVAFHSDFGTPGSPERTALAGKVFGCECDATENCNEGDNSILIDLYDMGTGAAVDGTGFTASPGGTPVISQINSWNVAVVYNTNAASDIQVINSIFDGPRVGLINQSNSYHNVLAYNYWAPHDAEEQTSRAGLFNHGAGSVLAEANHTDGSFTTLATAAQGEGIGPYFLMAYNRGVERAEAETTYVGGNCSDGYICDENSTTLASDSHVYFGNFLPGLSSGGALCSQSVFADCHFHRNVWYAEEMESQIDSSGRTTRPDLNNSTTGSLDNDNVDAAPVGWSTTWPSSFLYDSVGEFPSWACQESGSWPFIGSPTDDLNGGSPSYNKLPAQIRYESGTCTPLSASAPVRALRGSTISGGTIN